MASSWPLNGFILLSISVPENEIQVGGRKRRGTMSGKEKVERPVYMLQQCRRFSVSSNRTSSNRTSSNSKQHHLLLSISPRLQLLDFSFQLLFFFASIFHQNPIIIFQFIKHVQPNLLRFGPGPFRPRFPHAPPTLLVQNIQQALRMP